MSKQNNNNKEKHSRKLPTPKKTFLDNLPKKVLAIDIAKAYPHLGEEASAFYNKYSSLEELNFCEKTLFEQEVVEDNVKYRKDNYYMQLALKLAALAALKGEVPVAALLVYNDTIISFGLNYISNGKNPCNHAEIEAIRIACQRLNSERLINSTLYVTLEPCTMCTGALILSRIKRVIYGASDQKTGVMGSRLNLVKEYPMNHDIEISSLLSQQCSKLISDFFKMRRLESKRNKLSQKLIPIDDNLVNNNPENKSPSPNLNLNDNPNNEKLLTEISLLDKMIKSYKEHFKSLASFD